MELDTQADGDTLGQTRPESDRGTQEGEGELGQWQTGDRAEAWRTDLAAWAIPERILRAAPASPWGFPAAVFERSVEELEAIETPSIARAGEALPEGGDVLDVGAGGGAGSLPLARLAGLVVAVDENDELLDTFARAAGRLGIAHRQVRGTWPDVAGEVEPADVVVCNNVFYNVPDLPPFAIELTRHARQRVVAEMSSVHPATTLNHLWRHFHGIDRPTGPTANDALGVLREARIEAHIETWRRAPRVTKQPRQTLVEFVRKRLCLGAERDTEIEDLLGPDPKLSPDEMATLWWEA